jgi:hypothetical protein
MSRISNRGGSWPYVLIIHGLADHFLCSGQIDTLARPTIALRQLVLGEIHGPLPAINPALTTISDLGPVPG